MLLWYKLHPNAVKGEHAVILLQHRAIIMHADVKLVDNKAQLPPLQQHVIEVLRKAAKCALL